MPMHCNDRGRAGFSLIELLSVIAVIALMVALMAPALDGLGGTNARRGAVTTLMNVFEQARVAALEAGRPVYVVLWRRVYPERDAVMALRETEDGAGTYEQLTRWLRLPKGVLLHQPAAGETMLRAGQPAALDAGRLPDAVRAGAGESLNYLVFSESGSVLHPNSKPQLKLVVSEGVRDASASEALISGRKQAAGGFEIISISQFTGRAQLDVSTVQ